MLLITLVFSFCDMAKFLLSQPGVGYILSERFNKDPVECFFGQQRSRGQRNHNPSIQQFMQNTQAIIMIHPPAICYGTTRAHKGHETRI